MAKYSELFMRGDLPQPLSEEETINYFTLLREGNVKYKNILIEHNIRFVLYFVYNNYKNTVFNIEDLVHVGLMALMSAVNYYQLDKGVKFNSYLSYCLKNNIDRYIAESKKKEQPSISIDEELGSNIQFGDCIKDSIDIISEYEEKELLENLRDIISSLDEEEKRLIELHYGFTDGRIYTYIDLSEQYDISKYIMCRRINNIVDKIRKELISRGFIEETVKEIVTRKLSLYDYFQDYSKEEIDNVLVFLKEQEYQLLIIKFGENLISDKIIIWKEEEKRKFDYIVKKIKKYLNKDNVKKR